MMQLRVCCIALVLFFGLSCNKSKSELTIPEDKFISMLADAHLIESTLQNNYKSLKDSMTEVYYNQLYEIHEVSEEEFMRNHKILQTDAKLMSDIYAKVMDELSKMEADHK